MVPSAQFYQIHGVVVADVPVLSPMCLYYIVPSLHPSDLQTSSRVAQLFNHLTLQEQSN